VTPCMGIQRSVGMWLVAQNIVTPRLVVQLVAVPVHAALTCWLTFGTRLHYVGAGIAMSLSTFLQLLMMYGYLTCSPRCRATWPGFSRDALRDWQPYLQVALPGVFMNAEYFIGELLTFIASLLPSPDTCLSALSIYQLTQTTCYQIPSGIRMVVTTRVGNQLGAGDAGKAEAAQRVGLRLTLFWIVLPTALFLVCTRQWGLIFTTDADVLKLLGSLVYVMLAYSDADAMLAFYNGVLAACGQQKVSGRWAIRAYVLVGFPIAIALAFVAKLGTLGLVAGHTVGKVCHTLPCLLAVRRIDWPLESQRAIDRVQRISNPTSVPLASRG